MPLTHNTNSHGHSVTDDGREVGSIGSSHRSSCTLSCPYSGTEVEYELQLD